MGENNFFSDISDCMQL